MEKSDYRTDRSIKLLYSSDKTMMEFPYVKKRHRLFQKETLPHRKYTYFTPKDLGNVTQKLRRNKYRIIKMSKYAKTQQKYSNDKNFYFNKIKHLLPKTLYSMPSLSIHKLMKTSSRYSRSNSCHEVFSNNYNPYKTNFVINNLKEVRNLEIPFKDHLLKSQIKVFRVEVGADKYETCCCSCNSDAMFEVMKSLYDCYKKKNCDNCNCILCGYLHKQERKLGELRKSAASLGGEMEEERKKKKMQKIKAGLTTPLEGKSKAQKEKILKDLAKSGAPLPVGKTESEKELIKKVQTELGLPQEPKTEAEKEKLRKAQLAGLITPLEGKTTAQKSKVLKKQMELGVPLPEGRTLSEKALIHRIKTGAVAPTEYKVSSAKLQKAIAEGLLTPLEGKSPEQKEKIVRGLALNGIPLPEGKTTSERKLIDKVRAEVGLPPAPETASAKNKYQKAVAAGLITPLEGKTAEQKEKILKGQAKLGLPLPAGRTPSEKALIAKVRATAPPPSEYKVPSVKMRKAKAEGLLTPLAGKSPEQKEKIVKGLAMNGIPLPEGKTASERKLIDKVRAEVGLPPTPDTASLKMKYNKAQAAGLITPLEGKTAKQKEKILTGQAELGLPLPEGRTPSEKAIVAKVREMALAPSEYKVPSAKLRKAKAEGLLTPLAGKSPEQKEKIVRGLAMNGVPLPEGKTASEKKLIDKVRAEVGLPPPPETAAAKRKYKKAQVAGLITPLEGKTAEQKEKILNGQAKLGLPLPVGRTPSEKALIAKVRATAPPPSEYKVPSAKFRKAKAEGLLTPLEGKSPEQKEKIIRGLAMNGIPIPEGETASDRKLIDKVRAEVGLPPAPQTDSAKDKYQEAFAAGVITPLEGKSAKQKEDILKRQAELGLPLPEGRTPSEKAIVAKVREMALAPSEYKVPSAKLRKAKAEGLLTPLAGKSPEQKEKIVRGLAMNGVPLPEGKTASERKLIDKVRAEVGLPPPPETASAKNKYKKAQMAGLITPLEGKTAEQKEKILKGQAKLGLPLPVGRTPSEKALIAKVRATAPPPSEYKVPSVKMRKAKAEGLLTPLAGKSPEQKEKIVKGLAMNGIPLPEGKTASERKLIDKVRAEVGLPPTPDTASLKMKYNKAQAAGLITPLEGKTAKQKEKILKGQAELGLPLPEGRTPSEKAIVAKVRESALAPSEYKVPSAKLRKAKAEGLLTPLAGKSPEQKEKIVRGLAMNGVPLPEAKTASEKKLIDKVRAEVGLPPPPETAAAKRKYKKAQVAGLITPLEGKTAEQKEKILKGQAKLGLPLPVGRTPSEKALIAKVRATAPPPSEYKVPSAKFRKAKAEGLLTPLEGKSPEQKEKIIRGLAMNGIPLPEGETASDRKLIDKVRAEIGLPPAPQTDSAKDKYQEAFAAGVITPLEGKSAKQKEDILKRQAELGLPLPEGRTPSEKAIVAKVREMALAPSEYKVPSAKLRKAKAEGLLTPLAGKSPEQKEKIVRGLAMNGVPLPEGKTASEKKLIDKVRAEVGLPPPPETAAAKRKYKKAQVAGLITPLEGKTAEQKEKILNGQAKLGLPLPVGRTPSEKALIAKVRATAPPPSEYKVPSAKFRKAKAEGLLTPLEGKSPVQKEKIIRGLAMNGIPLPEGETASDRKLIDKVRAEIGLPPAPQTDSAKDKYQEAFAAGVITPLEGKSAKQKEDILKRQAELGLPLPEGRTPSEKAIVAKVREMALAPSEYKVPSAKLRKAKAEGLLTPLAGKSPEQKEKIVRGLAMNGVPLPEGKTASERKLINKVRAEVGLPPPPETASAKNKYKKAQMAGLITPLEGKTAEQKEKILKGQAELGLPLPEGRTPSEKAIVAKVRESALAPSEYKVPSAKLRKAKAEGLLTPLAGKSPEQKEKIVRGLAMNGVPLPEAKTASEKKLIDKVRAEVGLPPPPETAAAKKKYKKAQVAGLITPLEGKTAEQKEKILKGQAKLGLPLPAGRTPSEKALIAKVRATAPPPSEYKVPSAKFRKAKAEGLLTPLEGKSPEQKEKIIRGLAMNGIPLPEGETASDRKLIDKVRAEIGLPPAPQTDSAKDKYQEAFAAGVITPLEGKTAEQKEKILKGQAKLGLPLPEGRTPSEKALIAKVRAAAPPPSEYKVPSAKLRKAKAEGLLTPLTGKSPEVKEKIVRGLAMAGIPLPEGKTSSEKKLIKKVREDVGLPPEPKTEAEKHNYKKALAAGLITPLEGKTSSEKKNILQKQADMGIELPEGRTASEKSIIKNIKKGEKKVRLKSIGVGKPALPPERRKKLDSKTAKIMKEGKGPSDECICGLLTPESERVPRESRMLPPGRITSEKLRAAKAEGFLTPLEGKTPAQKDKILRGLAKKGLPLPEAKTASEKLIIDKVRQDLGLPPEPTTTSLKEKYAKAQAAGIITPLEGKTPSEKEKILTKQAKMGVSLPEGRTPSEKSLIKKVKAMAGAPERASERLRKAKAAGLLTPLEGKTAEQKEKIVRNLAKAGLPLPEGKTSSEKQLIKKVRDDMGLPVTGHLPSEKFRKAQAAGLITPLAGKSAAQKEKILKGRVAAGLPLPEGVTPSDKELIKKVKIATGYITPPKVTPSEKLRRAKTAGLLTPLEGKTPEQKKNILTGLAKAGIPLPEGKTPSEKKIITQVRKEIGLPPEPKTPSMKEKTRIAHDAGIITPLEGKTVPQKEKILRKMHQAGLQLPEGRTPSEMAMVHKIKGEPIYKVPSKKLKAAEAAGFITPLEGKNNAQKENILRGLAMHGIPLPEAKSASEKKIVDRVRAELGLPPEPKTASAKEKYRKAIAEGLVTPLEGKTKEQKEKILQGQAKLGLPLPEGRTPSEKSLIKKIRATAPPPSEVRVPSEKLRKAKAAGLLTPLTGKTPEQKEKILKGLAMHGIPLPEAKTASDKKIADKVRAEVGLPPEPKTDKDKQKYNSAIAAGIITPLQGKSAEQKEKILQAQAKLGLPLPEGRTPSEKALIAKVKASAPPSSEIHVPSEKLRKAKAAGLITPLTGKTPEQKEKIMRGLAMHGIPLPETKTASEKKIADKVRKEIGLPPEPKSDKEKKKYNAAIAAGLITPLQDKSPDQKARILQAQAYMGLPLPEGRTPSEKELISKIRETAPRPSAVHVPLDKLRKAKAEGLLTPLEGKTPKQKEKILKGLAMHGIPLPVGKSASEKALVGKIRTEVGLPPEPDTSSKKLKYKKALDKGLITPLEGKTKEEKTKILQGQAKLGLPLPEGRTPSEKSLIAKIKASPPPPSEKRVSSKKVGVSKSKGGIVEEYEDIIKTTVCDRGCGCDKKKIKFKHSYVKIRVTSPDISSFCPCPDECVPGVKGGIFTDNEGIKVTVGRVLGIPPFPAKEFSKYKPAPSHSLPSCNLSTNEFNHTKRGSTSFKNIDNFEKSLYSTESDHGGHTRKSTNKKKIVSAKDSTNTILKSVSDNNRFEYNESQYICKEETSSTSSFQSIYVMKTESSLSLSRISNTISVISIFTSSLGNSFIAEYNETDYSSNHQLQEDSKNNIGVLSVTSLGDSTWTCNDSVSHMTNSEKKLDCSLTILELSNLRTKLFDMHEHNNWGFDDDMDSLEDREIRNILLRIISERTMHESSSLIFLIPTSSEENSSESVHHDYLNSTICIQLSEKFSNRNTLPCSSGYIGNHLRGLKISKKHKDKMSMDGQLTLNKKSKNKLLRNCKSKNNIVLTNNQDKQCQFTSVLSFIKIKKDSGRVFSTDTTQDRPCCCQAQKEIELKKHTVENVLSELVTPMMLKEAAAQGLSREAFIEKTKKDFGCQSYSNITKPRSHLCQKTSIGLCKIPPCLHQNKCIPRPMPDPTPGIMCPIQYDMKKCCDCDPDKIKMIFEQTAKQLISTGCGNSTGLIEEKKSNLKKITRAPGVIQVSSDTSCSSCNPKKFEGTIKCKCSGKEKKITLPRLCPCEQHQMNTIPPIEVESPDKESACKCRKDKKRSKRNKNNICECPEEPEPELDFVEFIDEKLLKRMQSDLTQTTSGFKINIARKNSESIMSFEDALKYYAEHPETGPIYQYDEDTCACRNKSSTKSKNASVDCSCPYEIPSLPLESETQEEPFTGIKFHIGGKGSGSKGLSGILCFDLIQN